MGSITEKERDESTQGTFDALRAYKQNFFDDFKELVEWANDAKENVNCGADTLEHWIEISSRLQILGIQTHSKIVMKMAAE